MSNDNPYASPTAAGGPGGQSGFGSIPNELIPATQNRRLVNFIIDGIVGRVFVVIVGFFLGILAALIGHAEWVTSIPPLADVVLSSGLFLFYYFGLEVFFGRTVGKLLTGTMVVNADGGRPTAGQFLGRTLARAIPFEPFSALSGKFPNPWHDRLSKTRVVRLGA